MATHRHRWRYLPTEYIVVDREAVLLVVLFGVVFLGAVQLTDAMVATGTEVKTPGGVQGAEAGGAWAVAETIVAVAFLAVIALYRRLPDWVRKIIKWNAAAAILLFLGADNPFLPTLAVAAGVITVGIATDHFDIFWMVNNVLCVLLAVAMAAVIGIALNATAVIVALVGLSIYDHVFANKKKWMFTLGRTFIALRLPLLFVRPRAWRFKWSEALETEGDDGDGDGDGKDAGADVGADSDLKEQDAPEVGLEERAWGIGTADLALPVSLAAVVVSSAGGVAAWETQGIVLGILIGVTIACFRLRHSMLTRGGGAGLPPLATGAILGYAAGQLPVAAAGMRGIF